MEDKNKKLSLKINLEMIKLQNEVLKKIIQQYKEKKDKNSLQKKKTENDKS